MGQLRSPLGSKDPNVYVDVLVDALTSVWDKDNPNSNLRKIYLPLGEQLADLEIQIEAFVHDAFLSEEEFEEEHVRGLSTGDRLSLENAHELIDLRFSRIGTIIVEQRFLEKEQTTLSLRNYPQQDLIGQINIFTSAQGSAARRQAVTILEYDVDTNSITFTPIERAQVYFVEYVDSGKLVNATEFFNTPLEIFALGYGEGSFGFYGYGE